VSIDILEFEASGIQYGSGGVDTFGSNALPLNHEYSGHMLWLAGVVLGLSVRR
jgi:hypothetical protein